MNINELHNGIVSGKEASDNKLFKYLSVSFRIFAQQRIWNEQDSEEIVQDALLTIQKKYRQIEFETSFAAWAYKVLNNKMLDYFKAKRVRQNAHSRMVAVSSPDAGATPDPTLKMRLRRCLKKISGSNRRHARVLNLHYQGYSTEEICEKLGLKRGNFHVILSRARSMLEVCLEKGEIK